MDDSISLCAQTDPDKVESVYDGRLWQEHFRPKYDSMYDLAFGGSADPVIVHALAQRSPTPVLLMCLNLPAWVRFKLGSMWLMMLAPSGFKNIQVSASVLVLFCFGVLCLFWFCFLVFRHPLCFEHLSVGDDTATAG